MNTILIAEDERCMRQILVTYFATEGFKVIEATNGLEALHMSETNKIDVIIMDISMPIMDGFEATCAIREKSNAIIIMTTARDGEEDLIKGLNCGADEYVTKPVSPKVLHARVNALLKRVSIAEKPVDILKSGNLLIHLKNHEVMDENRVINLSPKEFELLSLLISNENKVLTREFILDEIWGYDYYGDYRTVDTHIKKLRKKLPHSSKCIKTIVRMGYKFEAF